MQYKNSFMILNDVEYFLNFFKILKQMFLILFLYFYIGVEDKLELIVQVFFWQFVELIYKFKFKS